MDPVSRANASNSSPLKTQLHTYIHRQREKKQLYYSSITIHCIHVRSYVRGVRVCVCVYVRACTCMPNMPEHTQRTHTRAHTHTHTQVWVWLYVNADPIPGGKTPLDTISPDIHSCNVIYVCVPLGSCSDKTWGHLDFHVF